LISAKKFFDVHKDYTSFPYNTAVKRKTRIRGGGKTYEKTLSFSLYALLLDPSDGL
jgi:hypothetical protein